MVAAFLGATAGCQRGAPSRPPESVASPSDSATYLFELLRSFGPPLYVQLHRTPAETVATWVRWRGDRSAPADSGRRRLGAAEWREFEARLALSQFWMQTPNRDGCGSDTVCTDGAFWILQGSDGIRHHRVARWSPSDSGADAGFRRLGLYMLHVSGAPMDSGRVD